MPDGCTVDSITAKLKPAGGHAGLPAGMPVIRFRKYILGNTSTLINSETDPSATLGTYQAFHAITVSGLSELISNSNTLYLLDIFSEFGAGSLPGLLLAGVETTVDTTKLDAGAA
jgi:hypothetical protein